MATTTEKRRIPLAVAEAIAKEIASRLALACTRIEIAGSMRRRRPDIGDIELVCVPRLEAPTVHTLFGVESDGPPVNLLDALCMELHARGELTDRPDKNGRPAFGQRYKRLAYRGVGLDLFSVLPPAQWGVLFTIRTGAADFSHKLVTPRLQNGWMPAGMKVEQGALWNRGAVVPTPEEEDLFAALGYPWLEPEKRTPDVMPAFRSETKEWHWYRSRGEWEAVPA